MSYYYMSGEYFLVCSTTLKLETTGFRLVKLESTGFHLVNLDPTISQLAPANRLYFKDLKLQTEYITFTKGQMSSKLTPSPSQVCDVTLVSIKRTIPSLL